MFGNFRMRTGYLCFLTFCCYMAFGQTPTAWNLGTDCRWGAAGYTWAGDFDGDGLDDIASGYGASVLMHLSTGNGFRNEIWPVPPYWNAPYWTWVGHFNDDNLADICTVAGGNAYMKLSNGTGFDHEVWPLSPSWGNHLYTWVADFNGDGLDDIASANGGSVYMKLATGEGFESHTWYVDNRWGNANYTRIGDFNGDGMADIASGYGNRVLVRISLGDHFLDHDWEGPPSWGNPGYTWVADFNGDGTDELATAIATNIHVLDASHGVLRNNTYPISGKWFTPEYTYVADFNGDGKQDIATASGTRIQYYLGNAHGFDEAFWPVTASWGASQYTQTGDFNGDGVADIASPSACNVYMKFGKKDPIDIHQPEEVLATIQRFSPTVYFHPQEVYFSDSVSNYLKEVALFGGVVSNPNNYDTFNLKYTYSEQADWNTTSLELGMDSVAKEILQRYGIPRTDLTFWLDPTPSSYLNGSLEDTKAYIKVDVDEDKTKLIIEYWYFFPYQAPSFFKACLSSHVCGEHEFQQYGRHAGQWENISLDVYLDSGLIGQIFISGHEREKETTLYFGWENTTHPIVYSALKTHAFYPNAGLHPYERYWSLHYGLGTASVDFIDYTAPGPAKRFQPGNAYDIVSTNIEGLGVMPPSWTKYTHRWGGFVKSFDEFSYGVIPLLKFKEVGKGSLRVWD